MLPSLPHPPAQQLRPLQSGFCSHSYFGILSPMTHRPAQPQAQGIRRERHQPLPLAHMTFPWSLPWLSSSLSECPPLASGLLSTIHPHLLSTTHPQLLKPQAPLPIPLSQPPFQPFDLQSLKAALSLELGQLFPTFALLPQFITSSGKPPRTTLAKCPPPGWTHLASLKMT